ncbi:MAG: hypothetical protein ACPKPY_00675 [Nitrososphaeraceae archaeon]
MRAKSRVDPITKKVISYTSIYEIRYYCKSCRTYIEKDKAITKKGYPNAKFCPNGPPWHKLRLAPKSNNDKNIKRY